MRQLLSLSVLLTVSEHLPPHGYKVIEMLHACADMKSKCDKVCLGVCMLSPMDKGMQQCAHKVCVSTLITWNFPSEEQNFVAVSVNEDLDVDFLRIQNKWNLRNLTTSINHIAAQPGCVIIFQHWALGKSKATQIKSDLIRQLHWALLSKAPRPTMH